jgi:hypothetical protein
MTSFSIFSTFYKKNGDTINHYEMTTFSGNFSITERLRDRAENIAQK